MVNFKLYFIGILACISFVTEAIGQGSYFNGEFVKLKTAEEFTLIIKQDYSQLKKEKYTVDRHEVIEFVGPNGDLLGHYFDETKVSISQLRWVKNNKILRHLLEKHDKDVALSIYYSKPRIGLHKEQLFDYFGEPEDIKFSIDGTSQIMECHINKQTVIIKDDQVISVKPL